MFGRLQPMMEMRNKNRVWGIPFAIGISLIVFGALDFILSQIGYFCFSTVSSNPSLAAELFGSNPGVLAVRMFGYYYLPFGVLVTALSLKSFSRGEKWAWYSFLLVLVLWLYAFLDKARLGLHTVLISIDLGYIFLWFLGLLLSYRSFFPKGQKSKQMT